MLLITGLGRCGTSVLTQFFKNMGFNCGDGVWYDHLNAGLEDTKTQLIHLYIYYADTKTDEGKVRCILRDLANNDVLKDPRIVWKPETLRYWKDVYGDKLNVLVLNRDVNDITASRRALINVEPSMEIIGLDNPVELLRYFHTFVMELMFRRIRFSVVNFPGILYDYSIIYGIAQDFGLSFDFDKGKEVWEKTIDLNMVHNYSEEGK